jgi:hypothetical protein
MDLEPLLFTEEMIKLGHFLVWIRVVHEVNNFIVLSSSFKSLFRLKCYHTGAWCLELIKEILGSFSKLSITIFLLKSAENLLLNFSNFIPFLLLNHLTSLSQPIDHFRVVVSKCDLGNFDLIVIIISQVWRSGESFLKLKLDIELKLSHFTHWVTFLVVLLLPCVVLIMSN